MIPLKKRLLLPAFGIKPGQKNFNTFCAIIQGLCSLPAFLGKIGQMEQHYTNEGNNFGIYFINFVNIIKLPINGPLETNALINQLYDNFSHMLIKKKKRRKSQTIFSMLNDIIVFLQPDNIKFDEPCVTDVFLIRIRYRMICLDCDSVTKLYVEEKPLIDNMNNYLRMIGGQYTFDMDSFLRAGTMVNDYICGYCNRGQNIVREEYLTMLREVFVLVFDDPPPVDFSPPEYLHVPFGQGQARKYRLAAQINSVNPTGPFDVGKKPGELAGGPFKCKLLRAPNRYFEVNGEMVNQNSGNLGANKVILFYHYSK